MAVRPLTWNTEQLSDGVLRVAFEGRGGVGSDGNSDGERMREAICAALTQYCPRAMVIDLSGFEYRFGDWIGAVPLTALRTLGQGRVCVLTTGETAAALHSLWEFSKLGQLILLFGELREAVLYLTEHGGRTDADPDAAPDRRSR